MQIQSHVRNAQTTRTQLSRVKTAQSSQSQGNGESKNTTLLTVDSNKLWNLAHSAKYAFQEKQSLQQPDSQNDPAGLLRNQMGALAQNKESFHATMQQVYGENYNVAEAESLREQTLDGNFDWLPDVRFVDPDVLGGAYGAYDAESETILLNANLEGIELAAQTFIEEAGHHIDTMLNSKDTAGDEGEMFRRLLGGESLSESDVQSIRNEDDTGTIVLDGKEVEVEYWSLKKAFKKHIQEPFKKHVREPFKKHVEQPLKGLAKDTVAIAKDLAKFTIELPGQVLMGTGNVVSALITGGPKQAWDTLRAEVNNVSSLIGKQIVDTGLMALHSVVNTIEGMIGTMEERKLTTTEIESLKAVYGDTIDYDKVRVQTGGIKNSMNMSAHVVGNDIFMPDKYLDGNGGFTTRGAEVLIHEMGHVWQNQNGGPEYISEALQAQNNEGDGSIGTGEGYDWLAAAQGGASFNQMNPESQAELAMFIGLSIDPATGEIDRTELQAELRDELNDQTFVLSDAVFDIAVEAHHILRGIPLPP